MSPTVSYLFCCCRYSLYLAENSATFKLSSMHYFPITFDFKNLSRVMVSCQDWNKKSGIEDNLKVALFSAMYSEYLQQQNK